MKKDTIYIDNDDEITSITDKVQSAKNPIVALVLPKRCTVLQSLVNMKILNRAANNAGKKVVLITSEAALLPVAGVAGLYVAKTLQSKPELPAKPNYGDEQIDTVNEAEAEPSIDATKSIGELASVSGADDDGPIELGDDPVAEDAKKVDGKKPEKKNKKLKVPNFDSFRVKLFLFITGVILLIVLWYLAVNVMPRAIITITTANNAIPVNMSITGSVSTQSIDVDNKIVPAQAKTADKTETKKFTATGEKNIGAKASGKVVLAIACSAVSGTPPTIPAGTGVSTGNLTFITQEAVSLTTPSFVGGCKFSGSANVVAQSGGDQYNIASGRTFSVAGYASVSGSNNSEMGGGTSKIIKVVSQADCESAKNDLLNTKTDTFKNDLSTQLTAAGYMALNDTFAVEPGKTSCAPDIDAEATEATATVTFKATMTGVNTAALNQLIQTEVSKSIEPSQSIFDTGMKSANLSVKDRKTNGDIVFTLMTDAQTGIKQDATAIAKKIAGKKQGETTSILRTQPGVTDVKVEYKPFWVGGTPTNVKHITVKFVSNGSK